MNCIRIIIHILLKVKSMFEHKKIQSLNDFFTELDKRNGQGVYFYRISGYNESVEEFVGKYYEQARQSGVVIEGKIGNPDEKNLAYYNEIMGMDFMMSVGFISTSLKKWLPRMNEYQRNSVAVAIYDMLDSMRRLGKNENMLKNAYIKFMCWLYYKFERIVNQLGAGKVPKILYEGEVSNYELMLLSILSSAGCDVVLLEYQGDAGYQKLDAESKFSDLWTGNGLEQFPADFNLKKIRAKMQERVNNERLYGTKPNVMKCTNAWIEGKGLSDIQTEILNRGTDERLFYNCFIRMNGVEDKLTYLNELYQFQLELKNAGRHVVIVDEGIAPPTPDEIAGIRRMNYTSQEQMLMDLANNIRYTANIELQRIMNQAFIDTMLEAAKAEGMNLNKLTNRAVYLLCWLKRYQSGLFVNWSMPQIGCFICLGGCKNGNEALFLRFLAKLPVDVLILVPNRNVKCVLDDSCLYEVNYNDSLVVDKYPQESGSLQIGTAAYHAERELDTLMYQDSGMYRNQQYQKATAVTLRTMYEEISLLWHTELKYRPNFSTVDDVVNIPVIFAKVMGVKDGMLSQYWSGIKGLVTPDTVVIQSVPHINPTDANPVKAHATEFFKNGKVQKSKIKAHSCYQYGVLREEMQEHILDKLQLLIDQKLIKGTFENGTEYTIISTVLNLEKNLIRQIQKFDFTKKNPKLIYINTTETTISLEDTILVAFLNLVGFDVIFFVPTGYQSVERYFNRKFMEEHQIGEYMYDLQIPRFETISSNANRPSWRDKIFKRGT